MLEFEAGPCWCRKGVCAFETSFDTQWRLCQLQSDGFFFVFMSIVVRIVVQIAGCISHTTMERSSNNLSVLTVYNDG